MTETIEAAPGDQLVNFDDLEAFIAVKKAYQRATNRPATLTVAQRNAISLLRLPSGTPTEISAGDNDWVGLILRYRDANHQRGIFIGFEERPGPEASWQSTCTFTEAASPTPMVFPGFGMGFVETGVPGETMIPSFARKRDAKQYAARCCAEWLMDQMRIPRDGHAVTFGRGMLPTQPQPPAAPATASATATAAASPAEGGGASLEPNGNGAGAPNHTATAAAPAPAVGVYGDEVSAAQRVAELCPKLGIQQPQYNLIPTTTGPNAGQQGYFTGGPDFGRDRHLVPEYVGWVDGIYPKKWAKEKSAEGVLKFLLQMQENRRADLERSFVATNGQV